MYEYVLKYKQAIILTAVGVTSWIGGSFYEKWNTKNIFFGYNRQYIIKSYPKDVSNWAASTERAIQRGNNSDLVSVQRRTAEIMKYGFPSLENLRSFDDFVLSYDRRNRIASWVFEHLTAEKVKNSKNLDRSLCQFVEDESVHPYFRSSNVDYLHSGYDRGHLAAAGNHKLDQRHCQQTFILSNISPQVGVGFNRHSWNRLEKSVRKLTKEYLNVYVCTGPLFVPMQVFNNKKIIAYEVIGENDVAVPTHFFKVVLMETVDHKFHLKAYLMPNAPIGDKEPLEKFQVPLDAIERLSGLLFFNNIDRRKIAFN